MNKKQRRIIKRTKYVLFERAIGRYDGRLFLSQSRILELPFYQYWAAPKWQMHLYCPRSRINNPRGIHTNFKRIMKHILFRSEHQYATHMIEV